jgi:CDP-glucose 4,6-dehydratase
VPINRDFWDRRRVLVTGHTGFKGAWLSLWLRSLGAEVSGLAPGPPTRPSLYELARVDDGIREHALDVRDCAGVCAALRDSRAEIVVHLAAQPLVRRSLRDPLGTYEVNVMGTASVLEAVRTCAGSVRAVVVVTSDKCYENERGPDARGAGGARAPRRFVESDPLGGADPYSSSKACAELVAAAYRRTFFADGDAPAVATARAGNVIGGGDWGEDRLIADIVRAVSDGERLLVRNPTAVRPWQHVLNPLSGYLLLAERLWSSREHARSWNFGPRAADARPVSWVVERMAALWDGAFSWSVDRREQAAEAQYLGLDAGAAEAQLGWQPAWGLEQALESVVEWHRAHDRGEDVRALCLGQIERFATA